MEGPGAMAPAAGSKISVAAEPPPASNTLPFSDVVAERPAGGGHGRQHGHAVGSRIVDFDAG